VAFNLAVWLARAGVEAEVIDADPQATLSDVVEVRREEGYEPGLNLSDAKALKAQRWSPEAEVVIDVGTADMDAMLAALKVADRVLLPVPPSQADVWSAQRFLKLIRENFKQGPEVRAFINRGDTHRSVRETDEAAAALMSLGGLQFLKPRLAQRTVYRRSFSEGLAVFEMEPKSKGARELLSLFALVYPHLLS
jgi:chromosome partitioning protein